MEQRAGVQKNQAEPGRKEKPAAPAQGRAAPELPLLELQHAAGNRAVGRLLRSTMGARDGDDPARPSPPPLAQLKAAPGASTAEAHAADAQAARHALSRGAGQPLDHDTRGFFEQSFGFDFSPVRVHHDSQAAESAHSLHALAYTYGHNIVFRNGHYAPSSQEGRRLLGHELAHVVQQSGGEGRVQGAGLARDAYETEADLAAARALAGRPVGPLTPVGSALVQKEEPTTPAPAKVKKPQPGVETPAPGTAYLIGKVGEDFVYVFNSEDALAATDIWGVVVLNHLRKTFPGINDRVAGQVAKEVEGKTVTGDWRGAAETYTVVGFTIKGALHKTLVSLVKVRMKEAVPVEPAKGTFDTGQGGPGGPGGGAPPPPEPPAGSGTADAKPPTEDVETIGGTKVHLPADLSAEEREKLLKLLKEFLAAPDPSKAGKPPEDLYVTQRLRKLLQEIADSPHRAEILAIIRKGDGKAADRSLEDALETAIAAAKMDQARKDFKLDTSDEKKGEPERRRPVRGLINNLSKELIPNKQAKFMMEFKEHVHAFRLPVAHVQWVAHKAGDRTKEVARDYSSYIDARPQGSIENRVFNVTFKETGIYTIVALVDHNFYEPNVFDIDVEVVSEPALAAELNERELKGFAKPGQKNAHEFDVGGLTGKSAGSITRGDLDPEAHIHSIEERLKLSGDKRKELEAFIKLYKDMNTSDGNRVASWAEDTLDALKESEKTLEGAQKEGTTPLGVRGVFASRTPEAASGPLNLLCYFIRKKGDTYYKLYLHDFSQIAEPTEYRFSATERTVEKAEEEAFIDQTDAYPAGTLSVTFQGYDEAEQKPSTRYVRFEKTTDTVGKKVKAAVFDPYVDIAVNLATAVMMVVPGLQGVAIVIAIAYNTARTVAQMEEQANKGTISAKSVTLGALEIGLNLIPLAGKGSKLITIAGKTFHTVEAITYAGNALLVSTQAMAEIKTLHDGIIKELMEVQSQITALEGKKNLADPKLRELKKKRDQLIQDGKDKARSIFAGSVFKAGVMMVGQHLIAGYFARKFSIGQLKSQGVFRHEEGVTAHYDFKEGMIVGDQLRVTPSELQTLQLKHGQNAMLEGHVADPAQRQQIVEALGDRPVEVQKGAKTGLREEGGKAILEVADGATPADILAAAQAAKAPPTPAATPDPNAAAPGTKPEQAAPAPAPDKPAAAPQPAADKVADTPAGQAEQAKQVVEKAAQAQAADNAEPPAGTPPPPPQAAPAKDAPGQAEKPAAQKVAPEDDFKAIEPQESAKTGEKPKADTPDGQPAADKAAADKAAAEAQPVGVKAGEKAGEKPSEAEGKGKTAEGAEPQPAEKPKTEAEVKAAAEKAAAEAEAEAAAQARKDLEATVRARFKEVKEKGYQEKTKKSEQITEQQFVDKYLVDGEFFGPDHRWHPLAPTRTRTPPVPVPAKTTTSKLLDMLKGPDSKSTFKKFYETITGTGFTTDAKVVKAAEEVRTKLDIENKPSTLDKVRHTLKEKFKGDMLDSMFERPDKTPRTPEESHARMRELTEGLDSADKGPMTEEWQQRTRKATAASEAAAARDAATAKEAAAGKEVADGKDAAVVAQEVAAAKANAVAKEADAAAAANAGEQVAVKKGDHPTLGLEGDRNLDRVEGGVINEVKAGEGTLGKHDFEELRDHQRLANNDATITVAGAPRKVTHVRWTFTSPDGAIANLKTMIAQMEANPKTFSLEVYNRAGQRKVFTLDSITGTTPEGVSREGALHAFLGVPYVKK